MCAILRAAVVLIFICAVNGDTLCMRNNTSCSFQLWTSASETACQMRYFPLNGGECRSLRFSSKSSTKDTLGNVQIKTYIYRYAAMLNITFSAIKWDFATFRFMERIDSDNEVCMARIFTLTKIPDKEVLYYDCPFLDIYDKEKVLNVDLELSKAGSVEIRKLLLKVPSYEKIVESGSLETREVFTYVDYSNLNNVILKIQPLQNVTDYKIEIWRERDGKIMKMDMGFVSTGSAVDGELIYSYNTWQEWGNYFFTVSFVNDICPEDTNICVKTTTPTLTLERRNNKLVIGIVGASVIIPILLYTVWIWNKQCNSQEALVDFSEIKPLLIYTPQTDLHNNVIIALAQTLKKLFRIDVLVDIFDIPQTKHKNPGLWCSEAFHQATHIVYVAPPNATETYPSVYKTESMALKFLDEYLTSELTNKKILCVTFSYSKKNVPLRFRNFRHFHLMKDFSAFIYYLVNYNRQNLFLCKSVFKMNQLMYYSEDSLYLDLVEAVKRAEDEMKLAKKLSKVKKPEILVLEPSEENIAAKEESENETLIKKEGEYSVNIKELDLSGEKDGGLEDVVLPKGGFDIRTLDM